MNEKYNKYLPLGSVVILKEAKKRVMITGFVVQSKEDKENKVYDYMGCLYPEGILDTNTNLLFDHNQIEKIYAIGYSDDEEKKFKEKLNETVSKQKDSLEISKINSDVNSEENSNK